MLSTAQERNRETLRRWERHYNTGDVAAMIRECYAPDCVMRVMGGASAHGYEPFLEFENAVLRLAPRRRLRIDRVHPCGEDVLVVEAVLLDPDRGSEWEIPWCTVLTFREGVIVDDRNYLDFSRWPSSEALASAEAGHAEAPR